MSLFEWPARYPTAPGFKARSTAKEAAEHVGSRASILRDKCLRCIRERGPLTADEAATLLGESVLSIRPRFSELATMGDIEDSGTRRKNASGRNAIAWKIWGAQQ